MAAWYHSLVCASGSYNPTVAIPLLCVSVQVWRYALQGVLHDLRAARRQRGTRGQPLGFLVEVQAHRRQYMQLYTRQLHLLRTGAAGGDEALSPVSRRRPCCLSGTFCWCTGWSAEGKQSVKQSGVAIRVLVWGSSRDSPH